MKGGGAIQEEAQRCTFKQSIYLFSACAADLNQNIKGKIVKYQEECVIHTENGGNFPSAESW